MFYVACKNASLIKAGTLIIVTGGGLEHVRFGDRK